MQQISSAADPIQQTSTLTDMIRASALGTLLDNVFTGEPVGGHSDVSQI